MATTATLRGDSLNSLHLFASPTRQDSVQSLRYDSPLPLDEYNPYYPLSPWQRENVLSDPSYGNTPFTTEFPFRAARPLGLSTSQPFPYFFKDPFPPPLYHAQELTPDELHRRASMFLEHLKSHTVFSDVEASYNVDPFDAQASQISEPATGTCRWVLDRPMFRQWRHGDGSNVISILAPEGTGKSVLAKALQRELQKPGEMAVAFFFNQRYQSRNTVKSCIASIIFKFLSADSNLARYISESSDGIVFSSLWDMFLRISRDSSLRGRIIILDGLDECTEESQLQLRTALIESKGSLDFRLCITGRPAEIPQELEQEFGSLSPTSLDLTREIQTYLQFKLEIDFEVLAPETVSQMQQYIDEGVVGMFLYMSMRLEAFEEHLALQPDLVSSKTAVQTFFSQGEGKFDYETYYRETVQDLLSLGEPAISIGRTILQILLVAQAPLANYELQALLSLSIDDFFKLQDSWFLRGKSIFGTAVKLCKSFVSVQDSKISIGHLTARDFLLNTNRGLTQDDIAAFTKSCEVTRGHELLARATLSVLQSLDADVITLDNIRQTNLLLYAVLFWARHVQGSLTVVDRYEHVLKNFFSPGSRIVYGSLIVMLNEASTPSDVVPGIMTIIVLEELEDLLRFATPATRDGKPCELFGLDTQIDQPWQGSSPLFVATRQNKPRLVEALLKLGANPDASPLSGCHLLSICLHSELDEIATLLVSYGADLDKEYFDSDADTAVSCGGPALTDALSDTMVQMLLNNGARKTARNDKWTALHEAAKRGSVPAMALLFDQKLVEDVDSRSVEGWTALQAAIDAGRSLEAAQFLIKMGADPNSWDKEGGTALFWAATNGLTEILKFLLNLKVNIDLSASSWTPLMSAVNGGHTDCIRELIEGKCSIDAQMDDKRTALILAASTAPEEHRAEIVAILVAAGADVDIPSDDGRTALYEAVANQCLKCVDAILTAGPDLSKRSDSGNTALQYAAYLGDCPILNSLVKAKAPLNMKTNSGRTALATAIESKHSAAALLLINAGADVEIVDNDGKPPLHIACAVDFDFGEELYEKLISRSKDIAIPNKYRDNALHIAASSGKDKVVDALLETEAFDTLLRNSNGSSALFMAALNGSPKTINRLMQEDFDADARTNEMWTALHVACSKCHDKNTIIRLLGATNWTWRHRRASAPSVFAINEKNYEALEALVEGGFPLDLAGPTGWTALHQAAERRESKAVHFLIKNSKPGSVNVLTNDYQLPYTVALSALDDYIAGLCKPTQAEFRRRTDTLEHPLHTACTMSLEAVRSVVNMDTTDFSLLGAEISCGTSLHDACVGDRPDVLHWLINEIAYPEALNVVTNRHQTPLLLACREQSEDCVVILLAEGADHKIPDIWGIPPLLYAFKYRQILESIVAARPDEVIDIPSEGQLQSILIYQVCEILRQISDILPEEIQDNQMPSRKPTDPQQISSQLTGTALTAGEVVLEPLRITTTQIGGQLLEPLVETENKQETGIDAVPLANLEAGDDPSALSQHTALQAGTRQLLNDSLPHAFRKLFKAKQKLPETHNSGKQKVPKQRQKDRFRNIDRQELYFLLSDGLLQMDDQDGALVCVEALIGPPGSSASVICSRCRVKHSGIGPFKLCAKCPALKVYCQSCNEYVVKHGHRGCQGHETIDFPKENYQSRDQKDFDGNGLSEQEWLAQMRTRFDEIRPAVEAPEIDLYPILPSYPMDRPEVSSLCTISHGNALKRHLELFPRDVGFQDSKGNGLAMQAIKNAESDQVALQLLTILARAGAFMLQRNNDGRSSVELAVSKGFERTVNFLLSNYDMDFDEEDDTGPKVLKTTLKRSWITAVYYCIERHFVWACKGEFDWIEEESRNGVTDSAIAGKLIDIHFENPWMPYSFLEFPSEQPKFNVEYHCGSCVHSDADLGAKIPSEQALASWDKDSMGSQLSSMTMRANDSVSFFERIALLCGIGGVFPGGYGSANFSDMLPSVELSYASSEKNSRSPQEIMVHAGLGLLAAVQFVQSKEQCCSSFTITRAGNHLHMDEKRPVIVVTAITLSDVVDFVEPLIQDLQDISPAALLKSSKAGAKIFTYCEFDTDLPGGDNASSEELFDFCALVLQFLNLGLLSFCAAHLSCMRIPLVTDHLDTFLLGGYTGYLRIVLTPVPTACIGTMVNHDLLQFSVIEGTETYPRFLEQELRYVLVTPIEIQELWGPANVIFERGSITGNAVALELRGGCITVVGKTDTLDVAHWSPGIGDLQKKLLSFDLRAPLIVGAVIPNPACTAGPEAIRKVKGDHGELATNSAYMAPESTTQSANINPPYFSFHRSRQKNLKAKETKKQAFMLDWDAGASKDPPTPPFHMLDAPWGLVVSACTGVAQRTALRHVVAIMLLHWVACYDHPVFGQEYNWNDKREFEKRLKEALAATNTSIVEFLNGEIAKGTPTQLITYAGALVTGILHGLERSGVNPQGNVFKIANPSATNISACIDSSCEENEGKWSKILRDSAKCATFAIFAPTCLQTSSVRCRSRDDRAHAALMILATEVQLARTQDGRAYAAQWSLQPRSTYYFAKDSVLEIVRSFGGKLEERTEVALVRHSTTRPTNRRKYHILPVWNPGFDGNTGYGLVRLMTAPSLEAHKFLLEKQSHPPNTSTNELYVCAWGGEGHF